jgi:hypothetical protein
MGATGIAVVAAAVFGGLKTPKGMNTQGKKVEGKVR